MRNMISGNQERTLMKLVVDAKTDVLLGVHIAGEDAPEMAQLAAVAVKAGLTKKQWDSTVALHPTAAEELVLMRESAWPRRPASPDQFTYWRARASMLLGARQILECAFDPVLVARAQPGGVAGRGRRAAG